MDEVEPIVTGNIALVNIIGWPTVNAAVDCCTLILPDAELSNNGWPPGTVETVNVVELLTVNT